MTDTAERTEVDWNALGAKFQRIQADMLHAEKSELGGADFTGEALRRLLGHAGSGFVTWDDHMRTLDANRVVDRLNGERAQAELRDAREKYAAALAAAGRVFAQAIRRNVNERTVPSALRREGLLLAADWIDPQ